MLGARSTCVYNNACHWKGEFRVTWLESGFGHFWYKSGRRGPLKWGLCWTAVG